MKIIRIIFTAFMCISFFVSSISADILSCYSPDGINLATASVAGTLTDLAGRDIAKIKFALLSEFREYNEEERITAWEDLKREIPRKEKTIFHPAEIQFFFREEPEKMRDNSDDPRTRLIRCRIKDKEGRRDYFALCSLVYDKQQNGFIIEDIFTQDEIANTSAAVRTVSDRIDIDRYVENNEKIIDTFIRDRIEAGDFTEILGRAEKLEWDKLYPENKRPEEYLMTDILDGEAGLKVYLDPFLEYFGTNTSRTIKGKNIVFIRTPDNVGLPSIEESGKTVKVRSHTSENAVYLFLKESEYQNVVMYYGNDRTSQGLHPEMINILDLFIHEIGVIYGLPFSVSEKGINNALDTAWEEYAKKISSPDEFGTGHLLKVYPELAVLRGDAKPLTYISGRDYAGGRAKNKKTKKGSKTVQSVERLSQKIKKAWGKMNASDNILEDKVQDILKKVVALYENYGRWDDKLDADTAYMILWSLFYGEKDYRQIIEIFEKAGRSMPEDSKDELLQSVKDRRDYEGKKTQATYMISDSDFLDLYFYARALDRESSSMLKKSGRSFLELFTDMIFGGTSYDTEGYLTGCYGKKTGLSDLMDKVDNLMQEFASFHYKRGEKGKALDVLTAHRIFMEKWIEEEKRDGKEEIGTVITGKRKKIGEIDRYIKIVSSDGAFLEPGIPAVSVPGPHMGPVSAGPMFSGPGSALPLKAAITPEEMLASVGKWYTPGPRFMPAPPKIKVNIPAAQKEKEDDISARNEEQITLEWKKLDDLDEDLLGSNAKEIYRKVIGFARNIDDEKHPIGRGTLYKVLFSSLMAESDHGYVIKVIDTAARRVTPAEVDRYKEELIAGPIEAKRHKAETTLIFSKKIIELYFFAKCMDPENIKKITDGKVSFFESVSDELFGAARGMECLNAVYARIENGLNGLKEVISEMQEAIIEDFYAQKEYKTVVSRAEVYLAYLGHEKRFSEDPEEVRRTEESIERTEKRLSAAEKEISGPQENRLRDKIRNEISAKKEVQISGALTGRLLGIIGKMFELEDPELFRELTADIADNVSPSPKAFRTVLCSAQMTKKMMISRFFKKMSFESFANVIRNAWRNSAGDLDGQKISPFADDEQKAFLFMNRMDVLRGVSKEQGNYVGASIWTLYKCLYSALYTSKEYKYMIEHYENSVQALPKLKEKLGEDFKYLAEMQELNTTVSDEEYQKKDKELKEKTEKYNDLEAFVHILQFVTVEKYLNIYFLARFLSMSKGEIANIPAGKNAFVVSAADDLYGKGNGLSKIEEYYKGGDGIKRLEKYIFGKEYGVEGLIDLYIRTERYGEASDLLGLYVTYLMKMKTFYGEEKNDNALKNTAQKISEMNTLRKKIAEGKEAFERALEEEVDARIEKIKKDERKAAEARDKKREMAALRKKERKEKTEPKRAQKDTAREAAKAAKKEKEKKIKIKKALAEAEEALAKDDPDRAQKQCEFVLRMDPGNEDAGKMMSAIEKERKRKEYLEALKMIPGHFSDAENALSEERFEAVIPPCRAILEVSPANKEANKILITAANKAFDLNLLDRAKQLCEFLMSDVCGTGDREGEAYYREAEDMLGDIRDIEKTFTINQMISSARTLLDEKNFNAALTRTETIIKKFPEDTEAPALLEEIKERAKKHNEKENKRKIAEFLIQAREAFEKGKYGTALILADEILGLDPENREAADILDISKMYIEASEAREKADATVDKESLGVALLVARTKEMTLLLNKTGRENIKKKVQAILRIAENENSSDGEKAAARAALLDLGYRSKDQVAFLTGLSEQPGQQVFVKAMAAAALLRHGVDPEKQVELLEQLVQGYIDTGMINNEIESAGRAYRGAVEKHIELQREINSKKRILIKDRKALERSQQNVKFQEEKIKEAEKLGTVLNGDVSAEAVARNALADAGINSDENGFWIEKRYMPLTKLMKERSFIDTAAASLLEGALFAGHGLPDRGWLLDKKRSEKDIISDLSALETSGTAFEPARIIASLALDKYRAVSLKEMPEEAQKAGMEVDTHPNTRYTLIVPTEFFANGEYVKHKEKIFGDRFDLEMIGAQNPAKYVNRILRDANGNTRKKIALVPDRTSEEHLKRLTNQDIRFIRMDFEKLIENKSLPAKERETFQINTYVIMMLTRALRKDENGKVSPSVRRTLEFYLMSHFGLSDIEPDKYIEAILEGNIAVLIKGILLSRPIAQYDMPDYHLIAAALIRA